jgi:hypothetical protein
MRYPVDFPRRAEEIHEMAATIVNPTAEVWTKGLLNMEHHLADIGGNMAPQSLLLNGRNRTANDKRRTLRFVLLFCRLVSQTWPQLPVLLFRGNSWIATSRASRSFEITRELVYFKI